MHDCACEHQMLNCLWTKPERDFVHFQWLYLAFPPVYPVPLIPILCHFLLFYPILLLPILSFPFIAYPILASFPVLCHPVFTIFKYSSSLSLLSYHFFLFSFFFLSHPIPPHPTFPVYYSIISIPILCSFPFSIPSYPFLLHPLLPCVQCSLILSYLILV